MGAEGRWCLCCVTAALRLWVDGGARAGYGVQVGRGLPEGRGPSSQAGPFREPGRTEGPQLSGPGSTPTPLSVEARLSSATGSGVAPRWWHLTALHTLQGRRHERDPIAVSLWGCPPLPAPAPPPWRAPPPRGKPPFLWVKMLAECGGFPGSSSSPAATRGGPSVTGRASPRCAPRGADVIRVWSANTSPAPQGAVAPAARKLSGTFSFRSAFPTLPP